MPEEEGNTGGVRAPFAIWGPTELVALGVCVFYGRTNTELRLTGVGSVGIASGAAIHKTRFFESRAEHTGFSVAHNIKLDHMVCLLMFFVCFLFAFSLLCSKIRQSSSQNALLVLMMKD